MSRGVVTEAYQRLTEDGQAAGRGRQTVCARRPCAEWFRLRRSSRDAGLAGWVLAPPKYRHTFPAAKRSAELGNAVLPQLLTANTDLAAASLARGVRVQPLSRHSQRPRQPGLVLGYAANTPVGISEGIATLGGVLRRL